MDNNVVNLGVGAATGYFYHAPKNTALPASAKTAPAQAWVEVGYISEDGITWHSGRTATPLKDWAQKMRRVMQSDSEGTVEAPIISTTAEVLKTLFGASHVNVVAATTGSNAHGEQIKVGVEEGTVSEAEAFLFIMKDGDDALMLGTTDGFITDVADVSFKPGDPITWTATISSSKWTFMKEG